MKQNPKDKNKKSEPANKSVDKIQPWEITKEMKESYLDYAMSVIIARAIPDARDGLKPVHRRILYAMHEMGLNSSAKYRKSANVTGITMAYYHPHGDVAIYDSLARMAQSFILRYPLIDGQGNWGSVDGDPPAAQRYCITGDSYVITNRCLEKIKEVSNKEDISLRVLSFNGRINKASKLFDSGVHSIIKVETSKGYNLKGSYNHPIMLLEVDEKGKPVFKWKLLENIKKGDLAVIDRSNQVLWPQKDPSLGKFYPKTKNRNFAVRRLPSYMDSNLAFLLGAILAEGYVSKTDKIGFINADREFINRFKSAFKKVFPDCPIYEQERNPLSYGKKKFASLEICSLYVVKFLKNLGLRYVSSREKEIPPIVLHSTKESAAAFLRGFVEGDGSIYHNKCNRTPSIDIISTSKELLQQIQILLLRFGIDSSLRKEKRYDRHSECWKLFIRGSDNFKLFKSIHFVSRRKREQLENFVKSSFSDKKFVLSKTDFVPFLSDYLRKEYKSSNIRYIYKEWLLKHNLDRYPKLRKYYSTLKKFLEKEDLQLIDAFLKQRYLFDKIVSIKKSGREKVYSFRVDSACHSYVSSGFISHNTECKLSRIGEEMLKDIEKETVDFVDNYDGTRKEPSVLPSPLPNLLLNGTLGIAVGMATNIPPHNLGELTDALCYLIDRPKATIEELFQFIKGPDFPTGGEIYNKKEIVQAYVFGRGPMVTRAKAEIIEEKGRFRIIVSELTYQTNKSILLEKIAELIKNKKVQGIKDVRDESDKEGIRVVIDLKSDAFPQKVLNKLYKYTDLQKIFHLNTIALTEGIQPQTLSLKQLLVQFISHREEVVTRRLKYELVRAKERVHILEGLAKALRNIDKVIALIKKSKDREAAKNVLKKTFKLTELQAIAILEMRLQTLAALERKKILDELKEKEELIKRIENILASSTKILKVIKDELLELKEKYNDERRTKVFTAKIGEFAEEDLVPEEETIITVTNTGYIKRVNPKSYRAQRRGGKGIIGIKTKQEDFVEHFFVSSTHDDLLFFSDKGKVYQTKAYEIPEANRASRGRAIVNILGLASTDKISAVVPLEKEKQNNNSGRKFLAMVTEKGIIKRTAVEKFRNIRKGGIIAITLDKGDTLEWVKVTEDNDEIMLITKFGQAIRFSEKDLRSMGRGARGVRGIRLRQGKKEEELNDGVVGMEIISSSSKQNNPEILIISSNGYGKRTPINNYKIQRRGGIGIKAAKTTDKTGPLVAIKMLEPDYEDLIVTSKKGNVIRTNIKSISKLGRVTQGVKIMRLDPGDKVVSIACV